MKPYYATMVKRWHTHPHLSDTNDAVGYHSGRMAVLALMIWPDADRYLLSDCLVHDLGEIDTGDRPYGYEEKTAAAEIKAITDMGLFFDGSNPKLKFLDMLDAYLWARHHKPELIMRSDWRQMWKRIVDMADAFGVDIEYIVNKEVH